MQHTYENEIIYLATVWQIFCPDEKEWSNLIKIRPTYYLDWEWSSWQLFGNCLYVTYLQETVSKWSGKYIVHVSGIELATVWALYIV